MSVKDGLRSRLRSHTSRERDQHTRQATNISLAYNFLTPLTDMSVERPQVLADGTLATEPTPTKAPAAATGAGAANRLPEEEEEEEEQVGGASSPSSSSQSLTRKKEQPGQGSKVSKATGEWTNKHTLTHTCIYTFSQVPWKPSESYCPNWTNTLACILTHTHSHSWVMHRL